MLPNAQLSFQPTSTNCLTWSEDGELAVAAGEFVHILIPRRRRTTQAENVNVMDPWVHVHFRINTFGIDEWPYQEPAMFRDFSIGEEQSSSTVTALAWSPLGLARNRRSVLAVLTSNLVLSLWASNSDPSALDSWERVLVVNNAVRVSWERKNRSILKKFPENDVFRRRQRIRSMTWAPLLSRKPEDDALVSTIQNEIYFLAVTNQDNTILFLRLTSPYMQETAHWDARIVKQLNIQENESGGNVLYTRASLLYTALGTKSFIDNVIWGNSWRYAGEIAEIAVTFKKNDTVIGCPMFHVSLNLPTRTFLSATQTYCTTNPIRQQYQSLEPDWETLPKSTLQKQMLRARATYDHENDFGDLSVIRTWGTAKFDNYLAACITLHPGDMVEYHIPSDERASILFSVQGTSDQAAKLKTFHWETEFDTGEIASTQKSILNAIYGFERQSNPTSNELSNRVIYATTCASMLLWFNERPQRLALAQAALKTLEGVTRTNFGPELECLDILQDSSLNLQETVAKVKEATGGRSKEDVLTNPKIFDICSICSEVIPWESLCEATCIKGHGFVRCALTFLVIDEPAVSKYCENCNREFLNNHILRVPGRYPELSTNPTEIESHMDPGFEHIVDVARHEDLIHNNDLVAENTIMHDPPAATEDPTQTETADITTSASRKPTSIAKSLFNKFDVCPYCQGKFIG